MCIRDRVRLVEGRARGLERGEPQRLAAVERRGAHGHLTGSTLVKRLEGGAAREGLAPDGRNRLGQDDYLEPRAVREGPRVDGGEPLGGGLVACEALDGRRRFHQQVR